MNNSKPAPSAATVGNAPALNSTNLILAAILIVQLVVTAYLYWPSSGPTTSGEPLLAGVTPEEVTAITITDNNARSVSFVKAGDTWTVANTDGYPARATKITETLGKLTAIGTDRLVTQTDGSHDRLQVADNNFQRKVELTSPSGTETLFFGSSSGASATHVRSADAAATYLTNDVATWELDTLETTWIEVTYFEVPKEQITEITLENANGTLTFVPDTSSETGEWTLADATADEPIASANISTLVDRIATLNLHSVLGTSESPDYGLDAPLATVTITASGATTETTASPTDSPTGAPTTTMLVVGAKDEEQDTYYLKSSDSEYYVRLAAFTGDEFVNRQRIDFMVQSSEQTGNGAAAPEAPVSGTESAPVSDTVPDIESSGVATETGSVDSQAVPTATLDTSTVVTETDNTATDDVETDIPEANVTPVATVDVQAVVTDTSTVTGTDTSEAEVEATEEVTSTATPAN